MCIPVINVTYACGHTEVGTSAGNGARENPFCLVPGFCDDLGFARKIRRDAHGDCHLCYAKRLVKQQSKGKPAKASTEQSQRAAALRDMVASRQRRATELVAKSDRQSQLEAAPTHQVLERLNSLARRRLDASMALGMSGTDLEILLRVAISLPLVDKPALVERFAAGFMRDFDDESCARMGDVARGIGNVFGEAFERGMRT